MCDFLVIGPLTSGCYYKGCFPTTRILPLRSRKCELKDPIFDRLKHIIMEIKGFQPTCSPSLELKLKLPAAVKRFFHMPSSMEVFDQKVEKQEAYDVWCLIITRQQNNGVLFHSNRGLVLCPHLRKSALINPSVKSSLACCAQKCVFFLFFFNDLEEVEHAQPHWVHSSTDPSVAVIC